jgi:ribosomal protein S18 acetylase RimI-like enzyme
MANDRIYPDEPAGPFPSPPVTFTDREDREIEVRAYNGTEQEHEALVEMYDAFDPADRAQGIPPTDEDQIRSWLDEILDIGYNVVAWDGDTAAGHATLVPQGEAYELAIFVLQEYQESGIGTRLIKSLLGYGADNGVERVWLTVERWNEAAVHLYRKIGFEPSDTESFELEMSLRLESDRSE